LTFVTKTTTAAERFGIAVILKVARVLA